MTKPIRTEEFNTCNGWGFGGGIGQVDTYPNGYRHRHGTAYFRHLNPEKFNKYYNADGAEITKANFMEATA